MLLNDVQGNSNKSYIKSELNFNPFLIKGIGNIIIIAQFIITIAPSEYGESIFYLSLKTKFKVSVVVCF